MIKTCKYKDSRVIFIKSTGGSSFKRPGKQVEWLYKGTIRKNKKLKKQKHAGYKNVCNFVFLLKEFQIYFEPIIMIDELDKTDLKILKILQQDGRITNLQLSADVGLSPAPTLERVKKLERAGYIKSYHAELDPEAMGMGIQAFMMVSLAVNKNNAIQRFEKQIADINEIVDCYHLTGAADYLVKIMVRDIHEYDVLIREKLSRIEEITSMQSLIILSQVKKSNCLPLAY